MPKRNAFTLIELLVVIAIIALLLAIVMPALSRAKLYARRIICGNDTRQQSLGVLLYTHENDATVPRNEVGGWLWDMTFWATNQLSEYAGFDDNDTFFCPANRIKNADDARFWQYSWLWPGPHPNPVPLRDESTLSEAELREQYRVLPIIYMFNRFDPSGHSLLSDRLVTGEKANWITKLSDLPSASSKIMLMDAVISEGNSWNFFEITSGGIDELSGGTLWDNTNHQSRQTIHSGGNSGPKPDGANTAYADGHVTWRRFEDMQHRYTMAGMWFWW